jgi:carboxymethylenebutenolidase
MERKTAADFDQELLILFDAYVHGAIDRRGFLDKAKKFAVGGVTSAMLLDALNPKFAEAQQVAKDDKRISGEYVEFSSPNGYGRMRGYMVRQSSGGGAAVDAEAAKSRSRSAQMAAVRRQRVPVVLVVHENRGLNPHIEDIARRLALEGFVAFAPDALFPLGGYPGDEDKAREQFGKLDQAKTREDFIAAAGFLKSQPQSNGRVGVVGFCYGGGMAHFLSTRIPDLAAAAPFYGNTPAPEEAAKVKAPLLIHFAEKDDRINAAWPAYEAALKENKVNYQAYTYPGTQHGFNNDTTPRYDEAAAKLAWSRTIQFFQKHLLQSS